MKHWRLVLAAVLFVVGILCFAGCAGLPDTWNYTVSVDHQTGETMSYVGVSGPITYPGKRNSK